MKNLFHKLSVLCVGYSPPLSSCVWGSERSEIKITKETAHSMCLLICIAPQNLVFFPSRKKRTCYILWHKYTSHIFLTAILHLCLCTTELLKAFTCICLVMKDIKSPVLFYKQEYQYFKTYHRKWKKKMLIIYSQF